MHPDGNLMKKSGRIYIRRGSAHLSKAEGGDAMSFILRIRESVVVLLCVAIVAVPCIILSRSAKPIDLLGQSAVKWRISYNFRMGLGEEAWLGSDILRLGVGQAPKWPHRLNVTPERVRTVSGGSNVAFKNDTAKWVDRVKHYKALLPELGTDKIRNVMDMNTLYGGFAAALVNDPVWVMNVVSSYGHNSLAVVYDRGLIGTYNDWCEAFSTYPRTYDLLHLDGLFTAESHRCEMKYVLLEMDRILRPMGYVIVRDSLHFLDSASKLAAAMRWDCQNKGIENGENDKERLLICQMKFWQSSNLTRTDNTEDAKLERILSKAAMPDYINHFESGMGNTKFND